jgi:hypothetical protein
MIARFKDWYGIEEVAEMFECRVEDINHFIQSGKLNTVLWFDDEPAILDYGDGKEHEVRIRGLWSTLKPLRYGLIAGERPVVYSINYEDHEKSFSDAFGRIVSSLEEAFILKKDGFPHIITGVIHDKFIVTDRVFRCYGESKTAKTVVLKKELDNFQTIVNLNQSLQVKKTVNKREEKTDLKIIGALVSMVREQTDLKSQAQIIDHIINNDQFKPIPGLSSPTIQGRFALANKALEDAGD